MFQCQSNELTTLFLYAKYIPPINSKLIITISSIHEKEHHIKINKAPFGL